MHRNPRGQTLVEYGLLIALVSVVVIAVLIFLGPTLADLYQGIIDTIQGAPPGSQAP